MKNVVFDTNIFISALLFGGKPEKAWKQAKLGEFRLFVSQPILEELGDVLKNKFNWSDEETRSTIEEVTDYSTLVFPSEEISIIEAHKVDNRILECALESNSEFLVSDDKHLLDIGDFKGVVILKLSFFLQDIG